MTTLRDLLSARVRRPSVSLRLAGKAATSLMRVRSSQAYGSDGIASGTVVLRDPPVAPAQGQAITWSWGFNGLEILGFTGYVVDVQKVSYPDTWELGVRDVLWLATREQREIATSPLNDITANAAITQILAGAGVTRLALPTIPRPSGGTWTLGQLTPVSWSKTTALAACQDICKAAGYWLYADAGGVVRATPIERRPSSAAAWSFLDGRDFLEDSPPARKRDGNQVRNRITVRGAATGVEGAQLWDTFSATHALYPGVIAEDEFSSFLLEYEADVTAVAQRLTGLLNRRPDTATFGALFNPYVAIAQTIGVRDPYIGLLSPNTYFVYSVDKEISLETGQARMSITADGGTGSSGYTILPPPTAVMAWRLVREGLDGSDVIEVFLDGSGSISRTEGEIVAWAWATSTPVQSGYSASATGERAMFVFPAATTAATITLTVTDTSSKTGAISQDVPLAGDALSPLNARTVSLALGSAWAVTPDGGVTWQVEATGDSTLVPEIGADTLLSTRGTGSTGLRGTRDALATASQTLASLGGQITALAQTVDSPDRVWAAVGASLYLSTDTGATFAPWATLPATIHDVLEDPAVPNSVFTLAGANLYHGAGDVLYSGPVGATARQMVRGLSGATTWICYTGTFTGSPLQRVEGPLGTTFPLGTTPEPSEIRAIALSPDELSVYAWDGEGRGWRVDSATGIATALAGAALPAGYTAQHALHDPDDPIVYLATFGPTEGPALKYMPLIDNLATAYTPAAGQQCHRIGLADQPLAQPELLLSTTGLTPGGVWRYDPATAQWTLLNSGLPSAWRWAQLSAAPFAPDEWIVHGLPAATFLRNDGGTLKAGIGGPTAFYRTADAGATWEAVTIDGVTGSYTSNPSTFLHRSDNNGWTFAGSPGPILIARGTGDSGSQSLNTPGDGTTADIAGQSGDLLFGWSGALHYLADGAGSLTTPAGTAPGTITSMAVMGVADRRLLAVVGGELYTSADYRAAQPAATGLGVAEVAASGGRAWALTASGICEVFDPFGAPSLGPALAGGTLSGLVAARQGGALVRVAAAGADGVAWSNGTTGRTIAYPAGVAAANVGAVAIIAREGTT